MRLFLAALYTSNFHLAGKAFARLTEPERRERLRITNILESYHYVHTSSMVNKIRYDGIKIFLDSGAFSAHTQGVEIDINRYCQYITENQDFIEVASVLDGIGDPLKTWQNQQYMESQGVPVLPCFHYGEPEEYLQHYVANYDYITLGGMVPISTPQLILWLDRIWDKYLTDDEGKPLLKVHGFGMTSTPLMRRYPWYSVDSSAWTMLVKGGLVTFPDYGNIAVGLKTSGRKDMDRHIDNVAPPVRAGLLAYLDRIGFDYERLRAEYVTQWCMNCHFYANMEEEMNQKELVYQQSQMGLF